jgi:hypothetical protein
MDKSNYLAEYYSFECRLERSAMHCTMFAEDAVA